MSASFNISSPHSPKRTGALTLAMFLAVPWAWAAPNFHPTRDTGEKILHLYSRSDIKILGTLRILWAGLYLEKGTAGSEALADVPKRLELVYARPIKADAFGKQADKTLKKILSSEERARLKPRIDLLHSQYQTVGPGDCYALTYLPGRGTELTLNGQSVVTIPGADFARAYFAIWLGPHSGFPKFTGQMLSGTP